jgi:hypothetical protein
MVTVPAGPGNHPHHPATGTTINVGRCGARAPQGHRPRAGAVLGMPRHGGLVRAAGRRRARGVDHHDRGNLGRAEAGELLARCCSAECAAVILPAVRARVAEVPYAIPDRPSRAGTVRALMAERPRGA